MLAQIRFLPVIGKTVTLTLATISITGTLKEITPDFAVLETDGGDKVETVYVFMPQILAIRVPGTPD
jgi:hypothetical protein